MSANSTSTASSTGAASIAAKSPPDPTATFVAHIDIFFLSVFGVFVLYALPRLITRFCHAPEWLAGTVLHRVTTTTAPLHHRSGSQGSRQVLARPRRAQGGESFLPVSPTGPAASDDSHAHLVRSPTSASSYSTTTPASSPSRTAYDERHVPPHFPAHSTHVPRLARLLRASFLGTSYTVGSLLPPLIYLVTLIYAVFHGSEPFTDPIRCGYLAASQLPLVAFLALKNSPAGLLLGAAASYTNLNYLHRVAGRAVILLVNVHAAGYAYKWALNGTVREELAKGWVVWGLVGLVWADVMLLTSASIVRRNGYEVFRVYHTIGFVVILVALANHASKLAIYAAIAAIMYASDRLVRALKTRLATATIRALPEMGSTRVEVRGLNAGWRPGQHVRLRVLSLGLGPFAWAEAHPFTIQSVARDPAGEGLVLTVKQAGNWTRKLYALASSAAYSPAKDAGDAEEKGVGVVGDAGRNVTVMVEGPYGGPGHTLYPSFDGALFVAGGSGITYALGCARAAVSEARRGRARCGVVRLVWVVQDPSSITPLLPLFSALALDSQSSAPSKTNPHVKVDVFYTRASASTSTELARMYLPPGVTLSPGRPKLAKIIESVADRTGSVKAREDRAMRKDAAGESAVMGPCGLVVGVCGPREMGAEVRSAVGALDAEVTKMVGGVEVHEE
ncbi:hypothetical protein PUNSTDRAFT_115913 [Punctularia strigosozonata HHB-11173 SS5]|uniref:uncharacterized protein n=1 Tax=Punctularia strigosozonata (strain HHB-11173) TaxID=741275 RepID=UPI00044171E4|nr:uncharacterized protein PUNSTDRAFT_115913 [Punctularia strigosozonata HHB-11173 SS5]EIN05483.1 hypothetical protein PUNSTDRAFT_115913 [Punctularia strigosozonata HHB-11173 SS5]